MFEKKVKAAPGRKKIQHKNHNQPFSKSMTPTRKDVEQKTKGTKAKCSSSYCSAFSLNTLKSDII